jgi:hypothetical protein
MDSRTLRLRKPDMSPCGKLLRRHIVQASDNKQGCIPNAVPRNLMVDDPVDTDAD